MNPVPDPDLEIRGGGGGASRPLDKVGGQSLLESSIHLKESGIPLINGIQNPSSTG